MVESVEIFPVRLRFRRSFAHHGKSRRESLPQIVRLRLSDGSVGHGEALPRPYVTGESGESVRTRLAEDLAPSILGASFADLGAVREWLDRADARQARERSPAAFCGLELALLDAVGRSSGEPVSDLLGGPRRRELVYDGAVIGFLPLSALAFFAGRLRDLGKHVVKVKVGRPEDAERLALIRKIMGDEVELVLDANGAWTAAEAIRRIDGLRRFGVAVVEQPVPGREIEAMAQVARAVSVPIMADESICTLSDARRLLDAGACRIWNLRVGKCGGLLGTRELARLAAANGIRCRLGVLVGESGVLGTAGRLLAGCQEFEHLEFDASGNRIDDVVSDPLAPIVANRAPVPAAAPGLGVEIDHQRLLELAAGPPVKVAEPGMRFSPASTATGVSPARR